jgi:hypothetical protein
MAADDQGSTNDRDSGAEFAQAARWAQRWRELEAEALDVAQAMADPEAKRYMLFLSGFHLGRCRHSCQRPRDQPKVRSRSQLPQHR